MITFTFLSTLLILSDICISDDGFDWESPRSPASDVITKNIRGYALYKEPLFYGDFVHLSHRRLLEHSHKTKQIYRSHDYNVAREHHRFRNKLEDGRPLRSPVVKNEDENEEEDEEEEEEEEENQDDEEDKLDDENANEDTMEEDEEETVAAKNRIVRSGYVSLRDASKRERSEMRVRRATEKCEDESTEPSQYYEYETEVKNVASQGVRYDKRQAVLAVKIVGASLLILLFT